MCVRNQDTHRCTNETESDNLLDQLLALEILINGDR